MAWFTSFVLPLSPCPAGSLAEVFPPGIRNANALTYTKAKSELHVESSSSAEVKNALFFISLIVEQQTCDALQVMINEYPRYPLDETVRHVESMADISNIDDFLTSLADQAKLRLRA